MDWSNRDERLKYNREYAKTLKRLHLCQRCKKKDAYTMAGRSCCAECSAKNAKRVYSQTYSTPEQIAKTKAKRKEVYLKHLNGHECTRCGKSLPAGYYFTRCEKCKSEEKMRRLARAGERHV